MNGASIGTWAAILASLGVMLSLFRYVLSSKIAPIEKSVEELKRRMESELEKTNDSLTPIREDLTQLKNDLLKEVRQIAHDNYEFRLKYSEDMSSLKLILATDYVKKVDCDKRHK